jgi:hypothetical protein
VAADRKLGIAPRRAPPPLRHCCFPRRNLARSPAQLSRFRVNAALFAGSRDLLALDERE